MKKVTEPFFNSYETDIKSDQKELTEKPHNLYLFNREIM